MLSYSSSLLCPLTEQFQSPRNKAPHKGHFKNTSCVAIFALTPKPDRNITSLSPVYSTDPSSRQKLLVSSDTLQNVLLQSIEHARIRIKDGGCVASSLKDFHVGGWKEPLRL